MPGIPRGKGSREVEEEEGRRAEAREERDERDEEKRAARERGAVGRDEVISMSANGFARACSVALCSSWCSSTVDRLSRG